MCTLHLLASGYNRCICTIHLPATPPLFPSHIVWARVKWAQLSLFDHPLPTFQQRTLAAMAEQPNRKRRKVADIGLKVELYVPHDKAHQVGEDHFDEWYTNVLKIYDDASKKIGIETRKFLKTQETLGIQAPMEPQIWRQLRLDDAAQ